MDPHLTLPPKGGTTNRARLTPGLRREFHLQPLAAARDFDFVFLIGLHLAEGVGVIVDVFDLAPGQLDYLVSGFQPGFCGGRIVAYGVEQHPVVRLGVVRHGAEIDAEAGRTAARLAAGDGVGRAGVAAVNGARDLGDEADYLSLPFVIDLVRRVRRLVVVLVRPAEEEEDWNLFR